MSTEGLDPHTLRWVCEQRIEVMHRNHGAGLGILPPEKFQSGFLPHRAVPVTRSMAIDDSGSDIDESLYVEEYVYGGRYSLNSSPRDEVLRAKVMAGDDAAADVGVCVRYVQNQYSSDTESTFSLSRETVRKQVKQGGVNRYVEKEVKWLEVGVQERVVHAAGGERE